VSSPPSAPGTSLSESRSILAVAVDSATEEEGFPDAAGGLVVRAVAANLPETAITITVRAGVTNFSPFQRRRCAHDARLVIRTSVYAL
jgi:hypothetical protein